MSSAFAPQPPTHPQSPPKRHNQHLEHELEDDRPIVSNADASQSDADADADENVIEGVDGGKPAGSEPTANGYEIVKNVLKVFGMDSSKIGAMAINLLIFIAQVVSSLERFALAPD